jgi:hypothetical protein
MVQCCVRFLTEIVAIKDAVIRAHVEERVRQGLMVCPEASGDMSSTILRRCFEALVSSHLRTATRMWSSVKGNSSSSSSSIRNSFSVAMNRFAARARAGLRTVVFKDRYISVRPRRVRREVGTRHRKKKESASRRRKLDAAKGTLWGAAWGYSQRWRHEDKVLNCNK